MHLAHATKARGGVVALMSEPHPGGAMPFTISRRTFVLATTGFAAQFALPHASRAQQVKVPTVDSLKVKVITDSSYDTPRAGTSKWVKVTRVPFNSQSDFRKTLHNEWGLALAL